MKMRILWAGIPMLIAVFAVQDTRPARHRNIIIFVADGLRHSSVNQSDAPTMWALHQKGVKFQNSYSLFPTFTMANASAIATGHGLGETGTFSNTIWDPVSPSGTPVRFIESNQILSELDAHYHGNYLGRPSLLALARAHGYNTAAVGKLGPTSLQDLEILEGNRKDGQASRQTIIVDDATGTASGVQLSKALLERLRSQRIPAEAPTRSNGYRDNSVYNNGNRGDLSHSGTLEPNVVQQQWMADVTTRGILPLFAAEVGRPFILLYWSRDPDGTEHYEGDSQNALRPGINGETSRAAIRNADHSLQQILDWLAANPEIKRNTDVLVTSDHGFATISRREIEALGSKSKAESAQHRYVDSSGHVDAEKGMLPNGFFAIDLARALQTNLWDPDQPGSGGPQPFRQLKFLESDPWEHPSYGNGLLGEHVQRNDASDAIAIVAANGGSDLIYVPSGNEELVRRIVDAIASLDYVGGIFVDDKFGNVPGALPLSAINLLGSTALPRPAIVVPFKVFYLGPSGPSQRQDLQQAVLISDTFLQEGQGMHGGFGRDNTFNYVSAAGPDFKSGFTDSAPVSNADIAPTLAHLMGIELPGPGSHGRVMEEALRAGPAPRIVSLETISSAPAHGKRTVLRYEQYPVAGQQKPERYLHSAEFR